MFRYLKPVFTFLPYVIGCYFSWIRKYARRPELVEPKESYQRVNKLIVKLNKAMDVELTVVGKENIPEGVNFFVSNHVGAYDPLIILKAVDKPLGVIAKIEASHYPFVGKLIRAIGGVFIDRDDIKQSLKAMIVVRDELLADKKSWLIFPEGTRNREDLKELQDFHIGSIKPAMKTNVPIVPVVVYNTDKVTRRKPHLKKYPVYVEFCKPIYADQYSEMNSQELTNYIKNKMQEKLDEISL